MLLTTACGSCVQADLQARQEQTTQAFALASEAAEGSEGEDADRAPAARSTALALASQWTPSAVLQKASLAEQVALLEERVALSRRQVVLDERDEELMHIALSLYASERPSRERRAEILAQQSELLVQMQRLVDDTRATKGHAAFVTEGFAEGQTY